MSKPDAITQGAVLVECLRLRPMTYGEMLRLGVSTCPWRRVAESLDTTKWKLVKTKGHDGLIRWRVRRLTAGER